MSGHSRNPGYIPGDHWVECQVCGFEYRQSVMKERWDGVIVCSKDWEPRHPQDFVRGREDDQAAKGLVNPPVEQNFIAQNKVWFSDNFNRSDQSLTTSNYWEVYSDPFGQANIVDNVLVTSSSLLDSQNSCYTSINIPIHSQDYYIQATCRSENSSGNAFMGIFGRSTVNSTNKRDGIYFYLDENNSLAVLQHSVAGGSDVIIDSTAFTVVEGVDYLLKLELNGSILTGHIDGAEVLSTTYSALTNKGAAGVWGTSTDPNNKVYFENFEIGRL